MDFPDKPVFTSSKREPVLPTPTTRAGRITSAITKRESIPLDEAIESRLPSMSREDFLHLYSILMTIYGNQAVFRFISISPPAPDLVCTVALHPEIPVLVKGQYTGPGTAIENHYNQIPGMTHSFPGMIASTRGIIIGDPSDPNNSVFVTETKRARRTRQTVG